ncbi:hypothetical protein ACFQVD_09935 [Streptosporangium amethystogenes subsp. fukuiense]|uniref:Uncharacterized protein n=1 Tax=Streptosporangium amethystogenes subsp. fukuiense TaxID=698418 RepID=A0ABW2SVW4_9ACTN
MFSVPVLLTLTATTLVTTIACALTLAAGAAWPTALLSGGAAGAATMSLLVRLLDNQRDRK